MSARCFAAGNVLFEPGCMLFVEMLVLGNVLVLLVLLFIFGLQRQAGRTAADEVPSFLTTIVRLVCFRGSRKKGVITKVNFPIRVNDLVGKKGPKYLENMLRHGNHLPSGVKVKSVIDENAGIKDGVKGDKAIIAVEYEHANSQNLPKRFFVKFSISKLQQLPMRVMCDTSEVSKCESVFYHQLALKIPRTVLRTPTCYFTDYNNVSGEFVLLTEVVTWKKDENDRTGALPFKHRIRDEITLEEQRLFITAGVRVLSTVFMSCIYICQRGMVMYYVVAGKVEFTLLGSESKADDCSSTL